jgi:hypothetical protein
LKNVRIAGVCTKGDGACQLESWGDLTILFSEECRSTSLRCATEVRKQCVGSRWRNTVFAFGHIAKGDSGCFQRDRPRRYPVFPSSRISARTFGRPHPEVTMRSFSPAPTFAMLWTQWW